MERTRGRWPAAEVTPLAFSEATGHIQDGNDSPQGAGHSNANAFQRPGTDSCASTRTAVI